MNRLLALLLTAIIAACTQNHSATGSVEGSQGQSTQPVDSGTRPAIAESATGIEPSVVGALAPRFEVQTVESETFVFDPAALERPAVVITFRGGWCPFCNLHLAELRQVLPEIRALGVDVLFLSGDRPELLYDSLQLETQETIAGLDYVILSDADAQAAIAFGIAFRAPESTIQRRHEKGDDIAGSSMARHGVLPVPSVFAIDRQGIIQFAHSNPDYKVRVPADELLLVAKGLAATPRATHDGDLVIQQSSTNTVGLVEISP
ncbi:MAG: AhpC/TSA family protein [Gammaproteobacteria bacterium]|nr:AhpC/TSA family protein [Gammaproteobacteria bacterium]